jgi:hypothetical protein
LLALADYPRTPPPCEALRAEPSGSE